MARSLRFLVGATLLALIGSLVLVAGCATDDFMKSPQRDSSAGASAENSPAASAAPIPLAGRSESDLAREMALHRTMYTRYLQALATFFGENGYEQKAAYARNELKDLQKVKTYNYITDAQIAAVANDASGASIPNIQLTGRTEPDLVEELVLHRTMYARYLRALAAFYSENGMEQKANWSRLELKDLQKVKTYSFILDAELPMATLRPTESIAEADRLYEEGHKLLIKGGHHVIIFYNHQMMNLAMAKFKELIARYPTSDKIDDAAYYIGEIFKEYGQEKDNLLAIEWYKRAIDWNPDLPHPAWSHCAHVLDFRLHEREKALEWYQKVLVKEEGKNKTDIRFAMNVKVAHKRISELSGEQTRYAPGEPAPEVQPVDENTSAAGAPQPEVRPEPKPSPAPGGDTAASPKPRNVE